jgi:hypothetical protein
LDLPSKRDKSTTHVLLVNIILHNPDNGCEALTLLRFIVLQLWGIKDNPISRLHSLQRRSFAMVRLYEASCQATLNMIF